MKEIFKHKITSNFILGNAMNGIHVELLKLY